MQSPWGIWSEGIPPSNRLKKQTKRVILLFLAMLSCISFLCSASEIPLLKNINDTEAPLVALQEEMRRQRQERQQVLGLAFVEAAHFALRFCTEAKRFHERKKAKTNTAVATKALAHKLARACFHILKEGQPFDVMRCFA
jgi:hypothetical protein